MNKMNTKSPINALINKEFKDDLNIMYRESEYRSFSVFIEVLLRVGVEEMNR